MIPNFLSWNQNKNKGFFFLALLPLLFCCYSFYLILALHPCLIISLPVSLHAAPQQVLLLTDWLSSPKAESILDWLDCHGSAHKECVTQDTSYHWCHLFLTISCAVEYLVLGTMAVLLVVFKLCMLPTCQVLAKLSSSPSSWPSSPAYQASCSCPPSPAD